VVFLRRYVVDEVLDRLNAALMSWNSCSYFAASSALPSALAAFETMRVE